MCVTLKVWRCECEEVKVEKRRCEEAKMWKWRSEREEVKETPPAHTLVDPRVGARPRMFD